MLSLWTVKFYYLNNSMEEGHSWEANSSSASQEISRFFWYPGVHCRVHRSPPLVPTLSQTNPVQVPVLSWKSIWILSSNLRLDLPSGLFLSDFPIKTQYMSLVPLTLFFSILTSEKRFFRSTDHAAVHYVVTSRLLLPRTSETQIASIAPYLRTPSAHVPLSNETNFHTHIE